jgi:hypothetical protein
MFSGKSFDRPTQILSNTYYRQHRMHDVLTGTDLLLSPEQRRYTVRRFMEYLKTNLHLCTRTKSFALIPFHLNCIVRMIATEILWMSSGDLDWTMQIPSEAVPKPHESAIEILRMMSKNLNTNVPKSSETGSNAPHPPPRYHRHDLRILKTHALIQSHRTPKAITTSTETQSMIPRLSLSCMQILLHTEPMTTPTTAEIYQASRYSVCAYR